MSCIKTEYNSNLLEKLESIIDDSLTKQQGSPADKVKFAGITLARQYLIDNKLIEDASNLIYNKLENSISMDDIKSILSIEIKTRQERPSESYTQILKKCFDDDNMVYIRNQQFRRSMFGNLFINVNPNTSSKLSLADRIVDSDAVMCKNIESQFDAWLGQIAEYLGETGNYKYYDKHKRTPESYELLIEMNKRMHSDNIKEDLKIGYYSFIKGESLNVSLYNAANAYLNIVYFDQILRSQYKSIIINKQADPKEGNNFKYSFVKSGADLLKHGWNDKDSIIDVVKEMGGLVQSTIENIPLIDYKGSLNKTQFYSYLTKEVFVNAITSVFDVISMSLKDSLRKLKNLLAEFEEDSDKLELILDLIFEKRGDGSYLYNELKKNNITDNQLNVLFSLREALYTTKNKRTSNYSYSEIENAYKRTNRISNRDSVVDAITNFIGGMQKMHYMKTEIQDGKLVSSNISEVINERDKFNIMSRLNAFRITENQTKKDKLKKYKFNASLNNVGIELSSGLVISLNKNIFKVRYIDLGTNEDIRFNGNIFDYFNDEIQMLKTNEGIKHMLDSSKLNSKEKEFMELIDMFNDLLDLNLGKDEYGLNTLYLLLNAPNLNISPSRVLNNLIFTSLKVLANMDLISTIEDSENYDVTDIKNYMLNENWRGNVLNFDSKVRETVMTSSRFGDQFKMVDGADYWVNGYQYALNVLQGNFDKSVLEDPSGNKVPKYSNTFLAAKFKSIINNVKKNSDHVAYNLSLNQGLNSDAIMNCIIDTYITIHDKQKPIQDLNHAELELHAIIDQFYSTLGEGKVIVQPTNTADKKKIPKFLTDLKRYKIEGSKTLADLKNNRGKIKAKIFEDFASYYNKMLENVLNKYRIIFDNPNLTVNEAQLLLKQYAGKVYDLTRLAFTKGIELVENVDYIVNKNAGKQVELNPLLLYYTEVLIKNPDAFKTMLEAEENNFINDLIKDDVVFDANNNLLNVKAYLSYFTSDTAKWFEGGKMLLKKDGVINPMLDYYFSVTTLLENALRLTLFDSEVSHTVKKYPLVKEGEIDYTLSDYILNFGQAPDFIHDIRNEAIYAAKDAAIIASNKRAGQLSSTLISLKQNQLNGIRPKIKVAVVDDYEAKVYGPEVEEGGIDAHDGGGFILSFLKYQEDNALQENKVGLIRKPILAWKNPLTGSSVQFKYAVNTLTNRFMRNSVNATLDTFALFKRMTNQLTFNVNLLRNDIKSNKRLSFSTDIAEGNDVFYWYIDPETRTKKFRKIVDFGYDSEQQCYYTVEYNINSDLTRLSDNERVYQRFDDNGNRSDTGHTIRTIYELYQAMGGLNSVELADSKYIVSKEFVDSERSAELVSNFMNNVNILKEGVDPKEAKLTQEFYDQPLKDAVIYCLLPHSAVKDGAANINPSSAYDSKHNPGALTYMTVGTTHYGPQNDSDHDAEESKVNELTQVMSSLDNGGRMHALNKLFYLILGKTIQIFSRVPRTVVTKFRNNNDRNGLYRYIADLVIDNFDPNKTNGTLGQQIIDAVSKELNKYDDLKLADLHFPFSDKNVYDIIANVVTSTLSKTAIKKQFSGGGMPMAPAYGFLQIYEVDGTTYQFNDLLNSIINDSTLLNQLYDANPDYKTLSQPDLNKRLVLDYLLMKQDEWLAKNPGGISREEIQPSDVLHFYVNGERLNNEGFAINTLTDYYSLMDSPTTFLKAKGYLPLDAMVDDSQIIFAKSIITPRDLAPDKILITYNDNEINKSISIFNTWPIRQRFEVEKAITPEEIFNKTGIAAIDGESLEDYKKRVISYLIEERDNLLYSIENDRKYKDQFGNIHDVVNVTKKNFEGIFSNINARKFGLTERTSLSEVMANGSASFVHFLSDIEKTNPTSFAFLLRFLSSSPDLLDTYISFDSSFRNKHAREVKQRDIKQQSRYYDLSKDQTVFQEIYSRSNDQEKQFLIGVLIIDKSIVKGDDGIYRRNGLEIDSTNLSTRQINGQEYVIENVYFVRKYEIDGIHNLLNINYKNIQRYIQLTDPNNKAIVKATNEQIGRILGDIYGSLDYENVYINKFINTKLISPLAQDLFYFSRNLGYNVPLLKYIVNASQFLSKIKSTDTMIDVYSIVGNDGENLARYFELYDDIRSKAMFSSFKKSLEFVVARIPSQSLQSFMKMTCVGFTQSPKNEAYVSHFQTYLQGSDYDYDKAYTLGYSISNSGVFVGWSNMFDYYSINTLNESVKLPFAIKDVRIREGKINNPELETLLNTVKQNRDIVELLRAQTLEEYNKDLEDAIINLIRSEVALLNYIDSSSENEIFLPKEFDKDVRALIAGHYNTDSIPIAQKENMLRNYVVNHIGNVITYMPNMVSAHNPIAMDYIRNSTKYAEVKDSAHLSTMNTATKLKQQYKQAVGKKGTGISANGEKVSFNWHYAFREKLSGGALGAFFEFNASRIVGRHNDTWQDKTIIRCLPDIRLNDYVGINPLLDNMIKNIKETGGQLTGNIEVDNAISQILSASTDNAKELILEKINGNENLLKCHLLLIALGVDLNDVAAFMSSPAVYWIAKVTQGNMYYSGNPLSMEQAINLVLNPREESQYDENIIPEEAQEFIPSRSNKVHIPTEAELNRMSDRHNTLKDFKADLEQFRLVLRAANEFTNAARLLALNQGIPGKDYIELIEFTNSIKTMLRTAEDNRNDLEEIRKNFITNNSELVKQTKFDPKNFDIDRWLKDYDYRLVTAKYYGAIKTVVNIFDLLNNLPHFSEMLRVLDIANELTKSPVLKNKASKRILEKLRANKDNVTDSLKRKIGTYLDSKLISYYLKQNEFELPIPSDTLLFNEYWDKIEANDTKLVVKDAMSSANFKYVFETFVIPMLKEGIYYDRQDSETIKRIDEELKENKFISSLNADTNVEGIPCYKLNVDTTNLNKRYITLYFNEKLNSLKAGFKKLSDYEFGLVHPKLGRKLNLLDLFVLYNLIVNKNRSGKDTLTNILDLELKNSLISDYEKMIGDLDWNSMNLKADKLLDMLGYSEEDFILSTAREIKDLNSKTKEPYVYIDTPYARTYYKNTRAGFKEYLVIPLSSQSGVNKKAKSMKLTDLMSYSVLSTNYLVYLNQQLSMLNLDNMFSSDIEESIREDRLNAAINNLSDKIRYNKLIIALLC